MFNGFVTAAQTTKQSNAQWRADVEKERTVEQRVKVLRAGLKGVVTARFGASGAEILKFGYALPKARTTSAETKAVAAVKAKATRAARGTKGSVQKQSVKGNVAVQLVVTDKQQREHAAARAPPASRGRMGQGVRRRRGGGRRVLRGRLGVGRAGGVGRGYGQWGCGAARGGVDLRTRGRVIRLARGATGGRRAAFSLIMRAGTSGGGAVCRIASRVRGLASGMSLGGRDRVELGPPSLSATILLDIVRVTYHGTGCTDTTVG